MSNKSGFKGKLRINIKLNFWQGHEWNLLQLSTVNKYNVYQAKHSRNILLVFFDNLSLPVAEDRLCGFDQLFQKYKWDMHLTPSTFIMLPPHWMLFQNCKTQIQIGSHKKICGRLLWKANESWVDRRWQEAEYNTGNDGSRAPRTSVRYWEENSQSQWRC